MANVYAGYSSDALLTLAGEQDGLTDDAQGALASELAKRGLERSEPEGLRGGDEEAIVGEIVAEGLHYELWVFHDMFAARRALELLKSAGISVRMRLEHLQGGWRQVNSELLHLYVQEQDEARATEVLRQEMGLFPRQEWADQAEEQDEAMVSLAALETREEALEVIELLQQAGLACELMAPRKDADVDEWISVGVREHDFERGLAVLAGRIDAEGEGHEEHS